MEVYPSHVLRSEEARLFVQRSHQDPNFFEHVIAFPSCPNTTAPAYTSHLSSNKKCVKYQSGVSWLTLFLFVGKLSFPKASPSRPSFHQLKLDKVANQFGKKKSQEIIFSRVIKARILLIRKGREEATVSIHHYVCI